MDREHLILTIARMYNESVKLSQIDFADAEKNALRDDLIRFAQTIHSLPRNIIDTGNRQQIAIDAETVTDWMHCLMNSRVITGNAEMEYIVRLLASHWGISQDSNIFVFAHGNFAVNQFNKKDALQLNALETRYKQRFTKEPRIVYIPQLYDGDLLFSSILFHEVGHMVERDYGIAEILYPYVEGQIKSKPTGKVVNNYFSVLRDNRSTTEEKIKSHIKEHVADIFGCQYLAQYILEFVKYKESSIRNVDRDDHPTYACRERIVKSMLDYMNSPTQTTSDQYLGRIIEAFQNTAGIDNLGQHYMLYSEAFIEQGLPINVNTEAELFSIFNLGWRVAYKGMHNLEQQRGLPNSTMSYNDFYRHINDSLRQCVDTYMHSH